MTYKNIVNASKKERNKKISFGDIIAGKFFHKEKGYTKFKIKDIKVDELLKVLGGRKIKVSDIYFYIKHGSNYGILGRLIFSKNRWNYIAGQDYTAELATIRKIILKGK